ncbi:MAG: hypothetical protein JKY53_02485 [Flavobacteriales bacterium]|nr:hypothetical protein [Flavobacteriales bacterium]
MKRTSIVSLILFFSVLSFAQVKEDASPYNFSAGIRVGFLNAGTAKYFLLERIAIEAIAGINLLNKGPQASLLIEYHHPHIFQIDNLYLFYGGGISTGYKTGRTIDEKTGITYNYAYGHFSTEGIFGFEYNFTELIDFPIAASSDLKPAIEIYPYVRPSLVSGAISIRYIVK